MPDLQFMWKWKLRPEHLLIWETGFFRSAVSKLYFFKLEYRLEFFLDYYYKLAVGKSTYLNKIKVNVGFFYGFLYAIREFEKK